MAAVIVLAMARTAQVQPLAQRATRGLDPQNFASE
jgi:hypothetical protein